VIVLYQYEIYNSKKETRETRFVEPSNFYSGKYIKTISGVFFYPIVGWRIKKNKTFK
jgi:hypothetical protein